MHRSYSRRHLVISLATMFAAFASQRATAQKTIPFTVHAQPRTLVDVEFKDRDGVVARISDFKGRVVLLNVWATWCPPCRHEMPSLDKLQAILGGKDFEVIALSVDRGGRHAVDAFFMEIGVKNLRLYIDQSATSMRKLAVIGLPTTLLIDRDGREVWRYAGAADWVNDEWMAEIRKAIAKPSQSSSDPR